jgi:DNA-binding XRE family transcriptional regulator
MKKILFPGLVGEMAKNGDTQETLANKLELCRYTILNKLSGKTEWTIKEMEAVCKIYNKSLDELFTRNEE